MTLVFILLATGLFAATLTAVTFLLPFESDAVEAASEVVDPVQTVASQFFLEQAKVAAEGNETPFPMDSVLRQLEEHIRQEQAAAEAFLQLPTAESLHAPTQSAPWN